MSAPDIAPYRPGVDDAAVLKLRDAVWKPDHRHTDPRFYRWLFRDNPLGSGDGVVFCRNGAAIGFGGATPRRLRLDGAVAPVAHGLEYMVEPSARGGGGGGAAVRLAKAWEKRMTALGFAVGVVFPNANSVGLLTSDLVGWRLIFAPRFLALPLAGAAFRENAPGGLSPALATALVRTLAAGLALRRIGRGKPAIVELDRFDDRFDELWRRTAHGARAAFVRDAAYLNWRYVGHPLYRYRIFAIERDGIAAFLVVSPRHLFGMDSLLVVDGWAAPEDSGLLTSLAIDVARRGRDETIAVLGAQAAPGSHFEAALKRAGFVAVPDRFNPKPFALIGLSLAGGSEAAFDAQGWHLTWGDMDVV